MSEPEEPRRPEAPDGRRSGEDRPNESEPEGRPPDQLPPLEGMSPGPARGAVGLRVALYLIGAMMTLYGSLSVLLLMLFGAERLQALSAQGDTASSPLLLVVLQAVAAPLVAFVTWVYVRRLERRRMADLGCRPWHDAARMAPAALAAAALLLTAWFVAASPWITVVPHRPAPEAAAGAPAESGAIAETIDGAGTDGAGTDGAGTDGADADGGDADGDAPPRVDPADIEAASARLVGSPGVASGTRIVFYAVVFLVLGALRELMFRGYIYSTLRERFGWVHAAGITTLLELSFFSGSAELLAGGLAHLVALGMLLAAVRERTGTLWTGALFHAAWNLLLACVLAAPSNGIRYPSIREPVALEGPAWATGGDYGPEASWLLVLLLAAGIVLAALWVDAGADDGAVAGADEPSDDE